jgi:Ca2+-transporting ATPase
VGKRLQQFGPNALVEKGLRSPGSIFIEQFKATMVLILLAAALLSAILGEFKDAAAIGAIVVLFALLGFVQEYRAERAIAALKRLSVPVVKVRRDGELRELPAQELVPGDIVFLEAGSLAPADARIIESASLRMQEAALTGESEAVDKFSGPIEGENLPLGDRRNMVYMGTVTTYGRGTAMVVNTGMQTELGKIANMIQSVSTELTPLQRRLDRLGKLLAMVGVLVAFFVFIMGWLRGDDLRHMLLTAVSIAVAIVPEGLPAVVTITLALGAQKMLKRNALIRKLPAVETLGSVTVICSDKTGTLTENRMTVIVIDVAGHSLDLNETMKQRMPVLAPGEIQSISLAKQPDSVGMLLLGGALCNDADLKLTSEGRYQSIGDPTEGALLVAAAHAGVTSQALQELLPRLAEIPFDSERKRMTTIHQLCSLHINSVPGAHSLPFLSSPILAFTKGSVDGLLEICTRVWNAGQPEPMSKVWYDRIQAANDNLAHRGMRVLGIAFRPLEELPDNKTFGRVESNLIFIGLVGMIDPPRQEAKVAVATARQAGIRPVMITGDHPLTARQIAFDLGILTSSSNGSHEGVLTGHELERMSDSELDALVDGVSVFARVSPEHKLRIVQALQRKGHIAAMTGDGVNDAPALRRANIGVAMGITGTDVTKEAAEMVLRDDNFATIVAAVEEGRTIYDNLRKFIKFSIAGNIGKVAVMVLAPFLGKPIPLLPLQLLWLNLLTDGMLGLGLGVEPSEKNVMKRPPQAPNKGIFNRGLGWHVLWVGALIGATSLIVGYLYWLQAPNGIWQTMVFSTLGFSQFFQALAARSQRDSLFTIGLFSNRTGLALAVVTFLLQMAVIYLPPLQSFFQTQPLPPGDLGISLGLSSIVFFAIEFEKWIIRSKSTKST